MRVRVRGPLGQSVITLDDAATVENLREQISNATSLSTFDVKYGYPPQTLFLDDFPSNQKLSEAGIKVNGEQLIVSRKLTPSARGGPARSQTSTAAPPRPAALVTEMIGASPHSVHVDEEPLRDAATGFSFGDFGTAPLPGVRPKAPVDKKTSNSSASAPLSLSRKQNTAIENDPPEIILPELGGTLLLRIMPDDNSCLFRAIANAVTPAMDTMNELRSIIASVVQSQPDKYSRVVLDDKDPDDYCRWIQSEDAWGGM